MTPTRSVRVLDLKDQSGPGPHPILRCRVCGETYSAHAGDYFMADPRTVFKHHRVNMALVMRRETFIEVAA